MDLNQLRIFSVIAQERTLARASSVLCLSQPAVSAQLKALEESLKIKLFDRTSRGMQITAAGQVMLEETGRVLAAADNVSALARKFVTQGLSGEFRLGTIFEPRMLRLATLISMLSEKYPHVQVSFSQGISGDVITRIAEREINAGYVIGEPTDERLRFIKIAPIVLRVVAPYSWRDRIADASWHDIVQLPWLSTPGKCSFRSIAARMFARHNVLPRTVIEADQESILSDLVTQGIGLTLLREDVAIAGEAEGKITIWSPGMELDNLYFVYLDACKDSDLMRAIVPLIRRIWSLDAA
ncbi:LysR family transcriptional regulator [Massilia forsythiae]|uniref:LysR family transcriptional regulator n=1 Tax=Massilia forsythiae TaxID=2728020 RepID=A0A7Z2VVA2_9BURK|nr:LysR family transcriptional regulator [Massilia forsythiae]QJD99631.1 LysR family transcriptional regulator [Massilia forsythiae]